MFRALYSNYSKSSGFLSIVRTVGRFCVDFAAGELPLHFFSDAVRSPRYVNMLWISLMQRARSTALAKPVSFFIMPADSELYAGDAVYGYREIIAVHILAQY